MVFVCVFSNAFAFLYPIYFVFEAVENIFDHLENRFSRDEKKNNTCIFLKNSR